MHRDDSRPDRRSFLLVVTNDDTATRPNEARTAAGIRGTGPPGKLAQALGFLNGRVGLENGEHLAARRTDRRHHLLERHRAERLRLAHRPEAEVRHGASWNGLPHRV